MSDGLAAALMFTMVVECESLLPPNAEPVYGQVSLWGRVIEHEAGWRGERAYPLHLRTRYRDVAQLIYRRYGVETEALAG